MSLEARLRRLEQASAEEAVTFELCRCGDDDAPCRDSPHFTFTFDRRDDAGAIRGDEADE